LEFGLSLLTTGPNDFLTFSTNLFYRKYIVIKNKLGCYLQFEGGMGWSKNEYVNFDSLSGLHIQIEKDRIYNLGITPGFYYRPSPRILIDVGIGSLSYAYTTAPEGNSTNNLSFYFLNNVALGVDFILAKR
jgi:hypothetical protein